jgi:hypothetical protein
MRSGGSNLNFFFFPKQEIKSLKTELNKNLQTTWRKEEKHVPAHNPRERI